MADAVVQTPWSTVAPLITAKPSWIPPLEQQRVQAYDQYDALYWNNNTNLRLIMRGTDDAQPIFVPEARIIVEATHRYVGTGFTFQVSTDVGTPASQEAANLAFTNLFRRERIKSRYNDNKRFGLVRGDWLWHITADTEKEQGSRLRILPVHPGNYFPVFESDVVDGGDPDRIVKVHIAERLIGSDGKPFVRRQTYERMDSGQILSSCFIFDEGKWFVEGGKPTDVVLEPTLLDPRITAFPVYHIQNRTEPLNPWGSSELRGLERIVAGLSQAVSDSDMALALEGLGVYYTESGGTFRDQDGNAVPPQLYPGTILRGTKIERVQGIGSLQPYAEHIDRLIRFCREASGTPDTAVGHVDVQVAESGVALLLQLGPMLAKAAEADEHIIDVHTQMFYDLVQGWFPAYEQLNFTDVEVLPVLGAKVPPNVAQAVLQVSGLVVAKLMSRRTGREYLATLGLPFAEDEEARLQAEADADAAEANLGATPDVTDEQFQQEAGGGDAQNT
jgi:hypothetical protein